MLFVPALLAAVLTMPPETPIACHVCTNEATQTFVGTVKRADAGRLEVFNGKTHRTMGFALPADFHGVSSSDGVIKNAPAASARPGLLVRVTHRSAGGRQLSHSADTDCPD